MSTSTCDLKSPAVNIRPRVISVNGSVIPRDAIARETQNHSADTPIAAWQAAARALVVRELLLQESQRLGIAAVPAEDEEGRRETDEEARMRGLIEQEVVTPQADEDACRRYYDKNRAKFRSSDLFEVRHILLAASPKDATARAQARDMAQAAIAVLKNSPEQFASMAAEISACPSGATGGSLGQIGPGQTVLEFERVLAELPEGEVGPEPVETRYGMHVVWVDRRIMGQDLPFEMVRERIREWLNERVQRTAVQQYLGILISQAAIEGIEMTTPAH